MEEQIRPGSATTTIKIAKRDTIFILRHLEQHHSTACHQYSTRKRNPSRQSRPSSRFLIDLYHSLAATDTLGLNNCLVAVNDRPATRSVDDCLVAIDDSLYAVRSLFDVLIALVDADDSRRSSGHSIEGVAQAVDSWECRAGRHEGARDVGRRHRVVFDVDDLAVVDVRCCCCCQVKNGDPWRRNPSEAHLG